MCEVSLAGVISSLLCILDALDAASAVLPIS